MTLPTLNPRADLPPRVRGARATPCSAGARGRLTPACAGSTVRAPRPEARMTTYPRVCGEHGSCAASGGSDDDLPPRVRGAPDLGAERQGVDRLTPACAGSTNTEPKYGTGPSTYPRVCGEHVGLAAAEIDFNDLPPRVRGALARRPRDGQRLRLTPACAGSTSLPRASPRSSSTYPRVCGEHAPALPLRPSMIDLPPRVRGAPGIARSTLRRRRLTPACAGSTPERQSPVSGRSTYPRVCGEHRQTRAPYAAGTDLPPRVRGAPAEDARNRGERRLTPACAGSTTASAPVSAAQSTYPRVCGEHCDSAERRARLVDLPPRVRGAPGGLAARVPSLRLTPACAGSTTLG